MLIALPLLAIPVVFYTVVIIFSMTGDAAIAGADPVLREALFTIPMASGASWTVGIGDLIVLFALVLLFFELLKSTSSRRVAIINHALSLILFVVCLAAFLLGRGFATSTFFLLTVMVMLDVLAGFIVTIISARKDFDIGAPMAH